MSPLQDRPPAVLLGGLNVTRAIGAGGIPVIVAASDPAAPAFASRYCRGRVLLPPVEPPAAATERLLALARAIGERVPLFYGDDDYLSLVVRMHRRLATHYRFVLNDPEVAEALLDKRRFDELARERGLPVPRQLDWAGLERESGPVLVKPKHKLAFEVSPVFVRLFGRAGKARCFASGREAAADPLVRALREEVVFQEYVAGDDRHIWSFHGYADERSRVLAWFTGRKIRTYPALTGMSSYLELAHDEALAALGHRLVEQVPLKGVFKMDFKRDAASGRFFLLEINARFNLWHYLGAANGINLPRVAYEYLLYGARPRGTRFGARRRWLSLRLDYAAYRDLAARGELSLPGWLASLAAARKVYDVFAWTDPLPLGRHWMRRLHRMPRATARLARRWLSTAS